MTSPCVINASDCVLCGGRLRNAIFCPLCGRSSCSWACYMRHLAQHSLSSGRPSTYRSDSRRHETPVHEVNIA
jgi:hypothetical protein